MKARNATFFAKRASTGRSRRWTNKAGPSLRIDVARRRSGRSLATAIGRFAQPSHRVAGDGPRGTPRRAATGGLALIEYEFWGPSMPLDANEREIVADIIGFVRTLAAQLVTLHLQLGAVRTLLARKGTISEGEFSAAVTALEATSSADEFLTLDVPTVHEAFDDLLRRLERLS
jgi:hypothetical protein